MATVYIQPGSGTGMGTSAYPYYYTELATAETAARAGGTILFTDGDYLLTTSTTWDGVGSSGNDITYKSLNHQKAVIKSSVGGTLRLLGIGGVGNTSTFKVQNFSFIDIKFYLYNCGLDELSGNYISSSVPVNINAIFTVFKAGAGKIKNNTIYFQRSTGNYFESNIGYLAEYSGNTLYISGADDGNQPWYFSADPTKSFQVIPILRNNIFMTDGTGLNTQNSYSAASTTSCFFQFDDTYNSSGGTNNVFSNPQFIDLPNGNFQLRPTSPCIGSNTNGRSAGISRILFKYPEAVWFDSHYVGGGSDGSVDAPWTTFTDANADALGAKVIAVKNGTHVIPPPGVLTNDLHLAGESISAVMSFSGTGYGGILSQRNKSDLHLTFENIKFYHNALGGVFGLIWAGNGDSSITATGCIFELGPQTLAQIDIRGIFSGAVARDGDLTLVGCTIIGGSAYGAISDPNVAPTSPANIFGGTVQAFKSVVIKSCTLRLFKCGTNCLFNCSAPTGVAKFIFEDNIIYGFNDYLAVAASSAGPLPVTFPFTSASPLSVKRNCYYNTGYDSSTNPPPDTSGAIIEDPRFVDDANYNFNLRPSSPCVVSPTTHPSDAVYVFNGTGSGGSGTYSNPYHLPEIAAAELDAGVGGTIIFKNGTYIPTDQVFLQGDPFYTRLIYKAESFGGVIFDFTSTTYGLTVGQTGTPGFTGTTVIKGITFKNPRGGASGLPSYACINALVDSTVYSFDNMIHFEECNLIFTDMKPQASSAMIGSWDSWSRPSNFTLTRCTLFYDGQIKKSNGGATNIPLIGRYAHNQAIILNHCTVVGGPNLEWMSYPTRPYLLGMNNNVNSKLLITNSIFYINPLSPVFLNGANPIGLNKDWSWTTPNAALLSTFTCENNVGYNLRDDNPGGAVPLPADAALKLIVDDPQLIDPSNNNLELRPISPCIGKGV